MYLSENQLSGGIPSAIGNLSSLWGFRIDDNQFTFKNIEPIFNWSNFDVFSWDFPCTPQADVGVEKTIDIAPDDPLHLSIDDYDPGVNDEYQWYKDLTLLSGETDPTLDVASAASEDSGVYHCKITNTLVTDLTLTSRNITVNITEGNSQPVADAGGDQTVNEGDPVNLNGSASWDPDDDPLDYSWAAPDGIELDDSTLWNPTFTAPEVTDDTTYTIILVVNDGTVDSEPDTVLITVRNFEAVPETLAVADTTVANGFGACFDALQTITVAANGNPVVFENGSTVELIAGVRINFLPGFHSIQGSQTHAYISTTFCDPGPSGSIANYSVETIKSATLDPNEITNENSLIEKRVKVYPNPNNGRFNIELSNFDSPAQLTIFNTLGVIVFNRTSTIVENATLDLSYLNRGFYFVKVKSGNFIQTQKIIIR